MPQYKMLAYASKTLDSVCRMLELTRDLSEEQLRRKSSPESWSVIEVLCHVEEALFYWENELKTVVQTQGGEWGRGIQHEGRLAAVAQANERTPEDVAEGLLEAAKSTVNTLFALQDEDLDVQAPHSNPKFGTKPMSFLLDHFVVEHLIIHIRQIQRNVDQ